MTASAVASSSAEASSPTPSPIQTFIKPNGNIGDNANYAGFDSSRKNINNNIWKRPYPPDLTLLLHASGSGPQQPDNIHAASQTPSSPPLRLSSLPILSPRSQQAHSPMFFLRSNNPALLSFSTDIGSNAGNNAARISAGLGSIGHVSAQPASLSSSASTIERGAAADAVGPIELSSPPGAASVSSTTAIPMHSASNKTAAASTPATTTATILSTSKRPVIIIYPTVSPESIVVPIVSCIFGFPLFALLVICCLRRRAKLARERDRRRNYDMQDHAVSLVRFSPIHRLNNRSSRAISLRPERSLSRGFPSLELDTVIEERSDPEQTQTDLLSPESPLDPQKFRDFHSS